MGSFKESKTAHNLLLSYSAEAQARTRYNFFSTRAREEGLIQIANIFDETAEQEFEHALRFFKFFNGGEQQISGVFPAGVISDTRENLLASAALERFVHDEMYAVFAKVAEEEGFQRAADTFTAINVSEKHHEEMYMELAARIEHDTLFTRDQPVIWKCLGCGYLHEGTAPPAQCPACVRPPTHFEQYMKNW